MAKNYINYQKVEDCSALENQHNISLSYNLIKMTEEMGEVAQALLAFEDSITKSASVGQVTAQDLAEECIDVINNAMNIINKLDVSDDILQDIFNRKCDKWMKKFEVQHAH